MRWVVLLIACCLPGAQAAAVSSDDQAVRYVNGTVITYADVVQRSVERSHRYARDPSKPLPHNHVERVAYLRESLEELTDEEIMVEKAKSLHLVPDHDRIVLEVLQQAQKGSQDDLSLANQARARRILEREQSIDFLLSYYYDLRVPTVSPAQLYQAYQSRLAEFRLPPRAHVLVILLRPTDPAVIRDIHRATTNLFKQAQDVPDAAVAAAATSRVDRITAEGTTAAQRDALLEDCLRDLAAAGQRKDLDAASKEVATAAADLQTQEQAVRTLDQRLEELRTLRTALVSSGPDAFREAAKKTSQGPHAAEGGDYAWMLPGEFPAEVDARVFAPHAHGLSDVFVVNQVAWLVDVIETEPAREKDFGEVLGDLEVDLHHHRREDLQKQVAAILRLHASITPVADLDSLVE